MEEIEKYPAMEPDKLEEENEGKHGFEVEGKKREIGELEGQNEKKDQRKGVHGEERDRKRELGREMTNLAPIKSQHVRLTRKNGWK